MVVGFKNAFCEEAQMKDLVFANQNFHFIFPIDGDCLNANDGAALDGGTEIVARVMAPMGHKITVSGTEAEYIDGEYRARIAVFGSERALVAEDHTTGEREEIRVFRFENALGGYRLSSDDNIIFLADINAHRDEYTSIFDNPYLAMYKRAHDLYGAKVHLNLFYEFDDEARSLFSGKREYFNLSMMTDKFRDEWRANADWLKLSFHSRSEMPPAPYLHADAKTVRRDAEEVMREIRRFAGEEVLSAATTVHFGEATEDGIRALRELGYRAFTGYFMNPGRQVAYYMTEKMTDYIYERDLFRDTALDVTFARIDLVLNLYPNERNLEILRDVTSSPTRGGFVSIMIHEQYFHPDYISYIPEFETRVLDACRFLKDKGYRGVHLTELLGIPGTIKEALG